MKKYIAFVVFVFMMFPGWSQTKPPDASFLLRQLAQSNTDTTRVSLLIQLSGYYLTKEQIPDYLDSAESYLKQAQQLNVGLHRVDLANRIQTLLAKQYCAQYPDVDAKTVFMPVIDACKKTGDKINEGLAWYELANKIGRSAPLAAFKWTCYQNALELARHGHYKTLEMDVRRDMADIYFQQQQYVLAKYELFHVLQEVNTITPLQSMFTYDLLAAVYMAEGKNDSALLYALNTVKLMGVTGDSAYASTFYNRLSTLYRHLGKTAEGAKWATMEAALPIAVNTGAGPFGDLAYKTYILIRQAKPGEALALLQKQLDTKKPTSINDQRLMQGALGNSYQALKKYELAEKSYLEMIRLGNQQTTDFTFQDKGYDHCVAGNFYFKRGNYHQALGFFETSLEYYEGQHLLPDIKNLHLWLFKTNSALGNYVAGIKHLEQSNQIGDSIFTIGKNKQIEELQIKYETDEKDKNIKLLEAKGKLDEVQLQYARSVRNWIIAGACMLLIIAGLLYRQTRMRKKNNRTINNKNEQLQHLVREKEWLLKEVHHRVKNNLHTVIGLLESQAAYLQDDALKANEISKHRIYAMSLIHQQLYKAEDIKTINMSEYLPELVDYLSESFGTERRILFQLDIEALKLGVSQAIPVALIVNEAVTNSIKYAFPSGKPGTIGINMHQTGEWIDLVITDDGIGIDPSVTSSEATTLGLKLMHGLTDDIEGEIDISNENGTKIAISFLSDPLHEPPTLSA